MGFEEQFSVIFLDTRVGLHENFDIFQNDNLLKLECFVQPNWRRSGAKYYKKKFDEQAYYQQIIIDITSKKCSFWSH